MTKLINQESIKTFGQLLAKLPRSSGGSLTSPFKLYIEFLKSTSESTWSKIHKSFLISHLERLKQNNFFAEEDKKLCDEIITDIKNGGVKSFIDEEPENFSEEDFLFQEEPAPAPAMSVPIRIGMTTYEQEILAVPKLEQENFFLAQQFQNLKREADAFYRDGKLVEAINLYFEARENLKASEKNLNLDSEYPVHLQEVQNQLAVSLDQYKAHVAKVIDDARGLVHYADFLEGIGNFNYLLRSLDMLKAKVREKDPFFENLIPQLTGERNAAIQILNSYKGKSNREILTNELVIKIAEISQTVREEFLAGRSIEELFDPILKENDAEIILKNFLKMLTILYDKQIEVTSDSLLKFVADYKYSDIKLRMMFRAMNHPQFLWNYVEHKQIRYIMDWVKSLLGNKFHELKEEIFKEWRFIFVTMLLLYNTDRDKSKIILEELVANPDAFKHLHKRVTEYDDLIRSQSSPDSEREKVLQMEQTLVQGLVAIANKLMASKIENSLRNDALYSADLHFKATRRNAP